MAGGSNGDVVQKLEKWSLVSFLILTYLFPSTINVVFKSILIDCCITITIHLLSSHERHLFYERKMITFWPLCHSTCIAQSPGQGHGQG